MQERHGQLTVTMRRAAELHRAGGSSGMNQCLQTLKFSPMEVKGEVVPMRAAAVKNPTIHEKNLN